MSTYCLKSKKDAENVDSKVLKNKNGRAASSKCAVCGNKQLISFLDERARSKTIVI